MNFSMLLKYSMADFCFENTEYDSYSIGQYKNLQTIEQILATNEYSPYWARVRLLVRVVARPSPSAKINLNRPKNVIWPNCTF